MTVINHLINNWYLYVGAIALLLLVISVCYKFFNLPTESQINKVKEWLIWACIEAEHELKSGTGKAKLAKVYNAFIAVPSFSWVARILTFDSFSALVDQALLSAKEMLITNEDLAKYVYGSKTYKSEITKLKDQLSPIISEE